MERGLERTARWARESRDRAESLYRGQEQRSEKGPVSWPAERRQRRGGEADPGFVAFSEIAAQVPTSDTRLVDQVSGRQTSSAPRKKAARKGSTHSRIDESFSAGKMVEMILDLMK